MKGKKKINWTKLLLELLVVFLGVSAGFLLQNIKEGSAQSDQEKKYIEGFHADVDDNITSIKKIIDQDSVWLNETGNAIRLMAADSFTADSADTLMTKLVNFDNFSPQISTYKNIINSGNLNLIANYDLKQSIISYHQEIEDYDYLEKFFQNHIQNERMPFLKAHYDILSQKIWPRDFHTTLEFKNSFLIYFSLKQQRWQALKDLLQKSDQFKNELNKY